METLSKRTITQLEQLIRDTRSELAARMHADDPFVAIRGQEHCKRSLVVAAVQGHTVGFFGPHGSGKSMLAEAGRAIGVPVVEGLPCPCGNYTDPRVACKCTPLAIERHHRKLRATVGLCDLNLECPAVPASELLSKQHGTTTAQAREQLARAGILPDKTALGTGCEEIIKQVMRELGLSAGDLDACLSVAQSIAALADSSTIEADSLLEAVHYRRLNKLTG